METPKLKEPPQEPPQEPPIDQGKVLTTKREISPIRNHQGTTKEPPTGSQNQRCREPPQEPPSALAYNLFGF